MDIAVVSTAPSARKPAIHTHRRVLLERYRFGAVVTDNSDGSKIPSDPASHGLAVFSSLIL